MKKLLSLLLVAATAISLCSCFGSGGDEESSTTTPSEEEGSSTTTVESEKVNEKESGTENHPEEVEKVMKLQTLEDVNSFLNSITVFRLGSPYAVVNGQRYDMGDDAIFYEYILIPAAFVEEKQLATLEEGDYFEKDGIEYVKGGNPYIRSGKYYAILAGGADEGDKIVISDCKWEVASDIFDEYSRLLDNLFATGTVFSAKKTGDRPVVFTTDEMLKVAKQNAEAENEPWLSTRNGILSKADLALKTGAKPDKGASATAYRLAACKDFINARYLALAFLYTEDEKYFEAAKDILMTYASLMLGTDDQLDYSAKTTDGQADIGLNIAVSFATACDVYSILYPYLDELDKADIEDWIREEAELCVKGHEYWLKNDFYEQQYGNNHLTSHLMGIIAAAYALEDDKLLSYALSDEGNIADLFEMIDHAILMEGDEVYGKDSDASFAEGEIYDRYRSIQNNGFGYAMYHLKFLTHTALLLHNNGIDVFEYCGKNGENIKLPFATYSEYLIKNDITLGSGHYANDSGLNRENAYSTYSIAYYITGDEGIKAVIDAMKAQGVVCNEVETFGITAPYLFGCSE